MDPPHLIENKAHSDIWSCILHPGLPYSMPPLQTLRHREHADEQKRLSGAAVAGAVLNLLRLQPPSLQLLLQRIAALC